MEQFDDISKHVEKAQGDKARFLKSKEGLLPHFEFPDKEAQQEKQFSKETLLADMYEERIDQMKKIMENPVFLGNICEYLQDYATWGSEKKGKDIDNSFSAFQTLSALITTDTISRLSPEQQNKINSYFENPILLENAFRDLENNAIQSSKKELNEVTTLRAPRALSALITTHALFSFSPEKQNRINSYFENPILLENIYKYLRYNAMWGSEREGKDTEYASWTFDTLSSLITTNFFSRLSPEQQNEINSYFENPILLENAYRCLQNDAELGFIRETAYMKNASWALQTLSSLVIVKDYLREKGKKIDDENFAKEALNPTEKIPPRPEGRLGK